MKGGGGGGGGGAAAGAVADWRGRRTTMLQRLYEMPFL